VTSPARPTQNQRAAQIALGAAVLSIALQSFGPIFVRKAGMPGMTFAFHRMWMAAAVYALIAQLRGHRVTVRAMRISAPGGLFFAFNIAAFFMAVQRTSVANATVIGALQPVALLFVVNRLFGERPTSREVFWTAVSIVGAAIVVFGSTTADTGDPLGDVLALVAMLGFAGYYVASKQARATLGAFEYQSALSVVAALALLPAALISRTDLSAPEATSWMWIALMVAIPGTGHLLMNHAHAYVRMSMLSVLTLLSPALSALLAWALLSERLVAAQVLGMVVTVGAVALMARSAESRQHTITE
jgi:drug/metabolite transporter (DMT)-like permease